LLHARGRGALAGVGADFDRVVSDKRRRRRDKPGHDPSGASIYRKSALVPAKEQRLQVIWPWQDGARRFSVLKAGTFALMFAPAIWLIDQVATGEFGPVPLGGMTYWSGFWATTILLVALAVTPVSTIFRWRRLIIVRRMVGVTALAYTVA